MRGRISIKSAAVASRPLLAASGDFQDTTARVITAPIIMTIVEASIDLLKLVRNIPWNGIGEK